MEFFDINHIGMSACRLKMLECFGLIMTESIDKQQRKPLL